MTDSEIEARIAAAMQAIHDRYDARFRVLLIVTVCGALLNASINVWRASHAVPSLLPSSNSQSVNVGSAPVKEPRRDWLTTAEVAERERVAPRTVQGWITSGEIPAERDGREYRIPANYSRRLSAADSRY